MSTTFNRRSPYLQLLPSVLFLAVLFGIPILMTFFWSVWIREDFWMRPGVTFAAYEYFVVTGRTAVFIQSLQISIISVIVALVLGYPVAYFLAFRVDKRIALPFLLVFVLPFIISSVIRVISWRLVLGRTGIVNNVLVSVGIVSQPIDWLMFSRFGVILVIVVSTLPFVIFPIWLSLRNMDRSILEASADLGAHPLVTFKNITLPMSLPGIFAATLLVFVTGFGSVTIPTLIGGGAVSTMGMSLNSAVGSLNYPLAATISSISILTSFMILVGWLYFFDISDLLNIGGEST